MHSLSPREIAKRSERSKRQKKRLKIIRTGVVFCCITLGLGLAAFYGHNKLQSKRSTADSAQNAQPETTTTASRAPTFSKTTLKTFTGLEFKELYRSITYPNTQPFSTPPEITGDAAADARIRELAERRGFRLTTIPVAPIIKTGESLIGENGDDLLQPLAQKAWKELKAAAKMDNIPLTLISAYRSPKWQRELFMERLFAYRVTIKDIAAGKGDSAVNATLGMTAVPGYSRHHTGYTIDLYCEDGVAFGASTCNSWIAKNNFEKAKMYGWIPSYPEGAGEQGPEPEPWEFVWVGTDVLYE